MTARDADKPAAWEFRSSRWSMFLEFVVAGLIIAVILVILAIVTNGRETGSITVISAALGLVILHIAVSDRVRVTVTDAEASLKFPWRRVVRLSRERYVFSSRIAKSKYHGLPYHVRRYLIADDGKETVEFLLPNFERSEFNALLARLRPASAIAAGTPVRATLHTSRNGILAAHRRVICISFLVFLAFVAGVWLFTGLAGYDTFNLEALTIIFVVFGFLYLLPLAVMLVEYLRKTSMPGTIAVKDDELTIDDTRFVLSPGLFLELTHPHSLGVPFEAVRMLRIRDEWGERRTYYMGMRPDAANRARTFRYTYMDYPLLCVILEMAAAARGALVVYDQ